MEWLDQANRQLAAQRTRNAAIVEHETEMFESLWSEVVQHVEAAKGKGFPDLFTNGSPTARVVAMGSRRLNITFTTADHSITGSEAGRLAARMDVDVSSDGVVCLTMDGQRLTLKEAAIHMLWPFLYPELGAYRFKQASVGAVRMP